MTEFEVAVDCIHTTSVIIEDLSAGKTYWFKVRAFNQIAVGEPSAVSKAVVVVADMTESVRQYELARNMVSSMVSFVRFYAPDLTSSFCLSINISSSRELTEMMSIVDVSQRQTTSTEIENLTTDLCYAARVTLGRARGKG